MQTYGDRLERALAAKWPKDSNPRLRLAEEIGLSVQAIGQVCTGKTKALTAENHENAVEVLGCSGRWLATGRGEMFLDAEATPGGELLPVTANGLNIPVLANAGAMGPGEEALHDDVIVGTLTVSPNWVSTRIRPTSDKALRFIHAYGDSMAPTFGDGDVLLVDTGARDPSHIDGVYVLTVHERLFIKRVRQRLDGAIEVSSDNPTVKTIDVLNGDHQIQVLGRVVWAWNGKKL